MIEFILGNIEYKGLDYIVVNNKGIGYKITATQNTISSVETGKEAKIYTDMVVREDDISLYGFSSIEERDVYRLLITVKGIGPKMAIGALSGMSIDGIINSIRNQDVNSLTKAPGIGKKTAERIILELKDKTDNITINTVEPNTNTILRDVEDALIQLGYTSFEVSKIIGEVYQDGMSIEDVIRLSLKKMTR